MIIYNAISLDVAQCLFNKCTAKQMSFESGFKCGLCFSTSDLFWKLITTAVGKISKRFVWTRGISNWLDPTDLSGLLGLYSVSISAMYLGPRPLSDL